MSTERESTVIEALKLADQLRMAATVLDRIAAQADSWESTTLRLTVSRIRREAVAVIRGAR